MLDEKLTSFKFEPTTPNTSKHVAKRWPNARNMLRPTLLPTLKCCDRLAGPALIETLPSDQQVMRNPEYVLVIRVSGVHIGLLSKEQNRTTAEWESDFFITGITTDRIGRHGVLLPINHKNHYFREKKNSQVMKGKICIKKTYKGDVNIAASYRQFGAKNTKTSAQARDCNFEYDGLI